MKRLTSIVGIAILSVVLIVPAAAWAHGGRWGGGHMMGYWGAGPGYYGPYNNGYTTLTSKQQEQLADLNQKFFNETQSLREKLWSKSSELNALLSETNPDTGKIDKVQKEISDLRAKLDEKAVNHQIEVRKIAPDSWSGNGYGYGPMMGGYGMGYGMGRYGMGYGMGGYGMMGMGYGMGGYGMGYGPGACWNY
ncbi:MAG: periplasmic heavy metal sensor [Desulfobacterales bacterium]|nr:periplasmic heavy metal sensor [Desulfobacterales bacterium]